MEFTGEIQNIECPYMRTTYYFTFWTRCLVPLGLWICLIDLVVFRVTNWTFLKANVFWSTTHPSQLQMLTWPSLYLGQDSNPWGSILPALYLVSMTKTLHPWSIILRVDWPCPALCIITGRQIYKKLFIGFRSQMRSGANWKQLPAHHHHFLHWLLPNYPCLLNNTHHALLWLPPLGSGLSLDKV